MAPKLITSNNGLVIKNLRKSLSQKTIVRNVSLKVQRGQTIGLLGPNGAGKTTTFYMIMGLIQPDGGEISLDDNNISELSMHERAIFRGLSVEDNIMAILETKKNSIDQKQNKLEELLTEFSLTHLRRAMPYMLSGGERRRTEIARCLAADPKLILMDEPTAGVDPIGISDIKNLIKQLIKRNIGVLITDHNVREVLDICDYSYVLHSGEIIAEGDSNTIIRNENAKKLYLGDSFRV
jgi:lipopolysaccharide export system ATP-binding protein